MGRNLEKLIFELTRVKSTVCNFSYCLANYPACSDYKMLLWLKPEEKSSEKVGHILYDFSS